MRRVAVHKQGTGRAAQEGMGADRDGRGRAHPWGSAAPSTGLPHWTVQKACTVSQRRHSSRFANTVCSGSQQITNWLGGNRGATRSGWMPSAQSNSQSSRRTLRVRVRSYVVLLQVALATGASATLRAGTVDVGSGSRPGGTPGNGPVRRSRVTTDTDRGSSA